MMRSVLKPCDARRRRDHLHARARRAPLDDAPAHEHHRAARASTGFDPDRWAGRRLRDDDALDAQRAGDDLRARQPSVPGAAVLAVGDRPRGASSCSRPLSCTPRFDSVRAVPSQIGGVARAADPCPSTTPAGPPLLCARNSRTRGTDDGGRDRVRDSVAARSRRARNRARCVGGREDRRRRDRHRRRVAGQRHVERDGAVRGRAHRRRRESSGTPRGSHRCPSCIPCSRSTTSSCNAGAWISCARTPTFPRPRCVWSETDPKWLGTPFLVMRRDRRRGAARHPAVRLRRLDDGRDSRGTPRSCRTAPSA